VDDFGILRKICIFAKYDIKLAKKVKNMKNRIALIIAVICCLSICSNASFAGVKQDKRVAYVLNQLKLDNESSRKLKPMLQAYLKDKKDASDAYEALKDKYKSEIKKGTLTDKHASSLLKEKWIAEQKELDVKKRYSAKFRTVLSPKKTYLCFSYLNDKWSKIEGGKTNDEEEDE